MPQWVLKSFIAHDFPFPFIYFLSTNTFQRVRKHLVPHHLSVFGAVKRVENKSLHILAAASAAFARSSCHHTLPQKPGPAWLAAAGPVANLHAHSMSSGHQRAADCRLSGGPWQMAQWDLDRAAPVRALTGHLPVSGPGR